MGKKSLFPWCGNKDFFPHHGKKSLFPHHGKKSLFPHYGKKRQIFRVQSTFHNVVTIEQSYMFNIHFATQSGILKSWLKFIFWPPLALEFYTSLRLATPRYARTPQYASLCIKFQSSWGSKKEFHSRQKGSHFLLPMILNKVSLINPQIEEINFRLAWNENYKKQKFNFFNGKSQKFFVHWY